MPPISSYIGPGYWDLLHRQAFNCRSDEAEDAFIKLMSDTCLNFPCSKCVVHCTEYIKHNPMEEYKGKMYCGKRLGMFTWLWNFHNHVNKRLGKNVIDWNTAYGMYSFKPTCETKTSSTINFIDDM